jgi:hypothetical protein
LSKDLFGHPILLHSLQVTQPTYPLPFIHFTIYSPLFNSSSSRFVLIFYSPSSYLGPYILLNIFLSKIRKISKIHHNVYEMKIRRRKKVLKWKNSN